MNPTPQDLGNGESKPRYAILRYKGTTYPLHVVIPVGRTARLFRWIKSRRELKRQRDYPGSDEYPRWKVRGRWITASLAVQHSFAEGDVNGLIACHGPGTRRSDIGLAACILGTVKENRGHRLRDKTESTGNGTTPGKLTDADVLEILRRRRERRESKRKLAEAFGVTRQAIKYHLDKHGYD
jgi:hypothetical protein